MSLHISFQRAVLSALCIGVLLIVDVTTVRNAEPKWAGKVEPLVIKDFAECNRLTTLLRECIKEFYEKNLCDSISDFVDFHEQYKNYKLRSPFGAFEKFYQSFVPRIQNSATYGYQVGGLIRYIIDSIISEDPAFKNIVNSIYAVSVDHLNPKTLQESIESNEAQPPMKKKYNILACIKLSIDQKIVYILMDPAHGSAHPRVIFNSAKSIGTSQKDFGEFVDKNSNTISANQNYVYTLYTDYKNTVVPALVYAGFPYLSVRDFTQKPSLLEQNRAIMKRDQNGKPVAGVRFNAVPTDISAATFFVLWNGKTFPIPFKKLLDPTKTLKESLGDVRFNIIQSANREMQLKTDELEKKLKAAGSALENIQFLTDIQTLNAQLSGATNSATSSTNSNNNRASNPKRKSVSPESGASSSSTHSRNTH